MRGVFVLGCCLYAAALNAAPRVEPVVVTTGRVDTVYASPGDTVTAVLPLKVARGYHVNANPAASEFYLPLELLLPDSGLIQAGAPRYPAGKTWRLEGTEEDLLVYGGTVEIRVPLTIAAQAEPGDYVMRGTLEFQACDDRVCLMPDSRPVALWVRVTQK